MSDDIGAAISYIRISFGAKGREIASSRRRVQRRLCATRTRQIKISPYDIDIFYCFPIGIVVPIYGFPIGGR
jgi:hypothetical protein